MRKYAGVPAFMDAVIGVNFLIVICAFVLGWIAAVAPTWVEFVDNNNNWYTIGLFTACRGGFCTYAWTSTSVTWVLFPSGLVAPVWYFYTSTPSLVVAAQFFYMFAIFVNMFSFCFWVGGSAAAALTLVFPAIFYTIGFACSAAFFVQANDQVEVYGVSSGYAFACGVANLVLIWFAILIFILDAAWRNSVARKQNQSEFEMNSDLTPQVIQ